MSNNPKYQFTKRTVVKFIGDTPKKEPQMTPLKRAMTRHGFTPSSEDKKAGKTASKLQSLVQKPLPAGAVAKNQVNIENHSNHDQFSTESPSSSKANLQQPKSKSTSVRPSVVLFTPTRSVKKAPQNSTRNDTAPPANHPTTKNNIYCDSDNDNGVDISDSSDIEKVLDATGYFTTDHSSSRTDKMMMMMKTNTNQINRENQVDANDESMFNLDNTNDSLEMLYQEAVQISSGQFGTKATNQPRGERSQVKPKGRTGRDDETNVEYDDLFLFDHNFETFFVDSTKIGDNNNNNNHNNSSSKNNDADHFLSDYLALTPNLEDDDDTGDDDNDDHHHHCFSSYKPQAGSGCGIDDYLLSRSTRKLKLPKASDPSRTESLNQTHTKPSHHTQSQLLTNPLNSRPQHSTRAEQRPTRSTRPLGPTNPLSNNNTDLQSQVVLHSHHHQLDDNDPYLHDSLGESTVDIIQSLFNPHSVPLHLLSSASTVQNELSIHDFGDKRNYNPSHQLTRPQTKIEPQIIQQQQQQQQHRYQPSSSAKYTSSADYSGDCDTYRSIDLTLGLIGKIANGERMVADQQHKQTSHSIQPTNSIGMNPKNTHPIGEINPRPLSKVDQMKLHKIEKHKEEWVLQEADFKPIDPVKSWDEKQHDFLAGNTQDLSQRVKKKGQFSPDKTPLDECNSDNEYNGDGASMISHNLPTTRRNKRKSYAYALLTTQDEVPEPVKSTQTLNKSKRNHDADVHTNLLQSTRSAISNNSVAKSSVLTESDQTTRDNRNKPTTTTNTNTNTATQHLPQPPPSKTIPHPHPLLAMTQHLVAETHDLFEEIGGLEAASSLMAFATAQSLHNSSHPLKAIPAPHPQDSNQFSNRIQASYSTYISPQYALPFLKLGMVLFYDEKKVAGLPTMLFNALPITTDLLNSWFESIIYAIITIPPNFNSSLVSSSSTTGISLNSHLVDVTTRLTDALNFIRTDSLQNSHLNMNTANPTTTINTSLTNPFLQSTFPFVYSATIGKGSETSTKSTPPLPPVDPRFQILNACILLYIYLFELFSTSTIANNTDSAGKRLVKAPGMAQLLIKSQLSNIISAFADFAQILIKIHFNSTFIRGLDQNLANMHTLICRFSSDSHSHRPDSFSPWFENESFSATRIIDGIINRCCWGDDQQPKGALGEGDKATLNLFELSRHISTTLHKMSVLFPRVEMPQVPSNRHSIASSTGSIAESFAQAMSKNSSKMIKGSLNQHQLASLVPSNHTKEAPMTTTRPDPIKPYDAERGWLQSSSQAARELTNGDHFTYNNSVSNNNILTHLGLNSKTSNASKDKRMKGTSNRHHSLVLNQSMNSYSSDYSCAHTNSLLDLDFDSLNTTSVSYQGDNGTKHTHSTPIPPSALLASANSLLMNPVGFIKRKQSGEDNDDNDDNDNDGEGGAHFEPILANKSTGSKPVLRGLSSHPIKKQRTSTSSNGSTRSITSNPIGNTLSTHHHPDSLASLNQNTIKQPKTKTPLSTTTTTTTVSAQHYKKPVTTFQQQNPQNQKQSVDRSKVITSFPSTPIRQHRIQKQYLTPQHGVSLKIDNATSHSQPVNLVGNSDGAQIPSTHTTSPKQPLESKARTRTEMPKATVLSRPTTTLTTTLTTAATNPSKSAKATKPTFIPTTQSTTTKKISTLNSPKSTMNDRGLSSRPGAGRPVPTFNPVTTYTNPNVHSATIKSTIPSAISSRSTAMANPAKMPGAGIQSRLTTKAIPGTRQPAVNALPVAPRPTTKITTLPSIVGIQSHGNLPGAQIIGHKTTIKNPAGAMQNKSTTPVAAQITTQTTLPHQPATASDGGALKGFVRKRINITAIQTGKKKV